MRRLRSIQECGRVRPIDGRKQLEREHPLLKGAAAVRLRSSPVHERY
jgi:hypothetical protein